MIDEEDSSIGKVQDPVEKLRIEVDGLQFKVEQTNDRATEELKKFIALLDAKEKGLVEKIDARNTDDLNNLVVKKLEDINIDDKTFGII